MSSHSSWGRRFRLRRTSCRTLLEQGTMCGWPPTLSVGFSTKSTFVNDMASVGQLDNRLIITKRSLPHSVFWLQLHHLHSWRLGSVHPSMSNLCQPRKQGWKGAKKGGWVSCNGLSLAEPPLNSRCVLCVAFRHVFPFRLRWESLRTWNRVKATPQNSSEDIGELTASTVLLLSKQALDWGWSAYAGQLSGKLHRNTLIFGHLTSLGSGRPLVTFMRLQWGSLVAKFYRKGEILLQQNRCKIKTLLAEDSIWKREWISEHSQWGRMWLAGSRTSPEGRSTLGWAARSTSEGGQDEVWAMGSMARPSGPKDAYLLTMRRPVDERIMPEWFEQQPGHSGNVATVHVPLTYCSACYCCISVLDWSTSEHTNRTYYVYHRVNDK